MATLSPKARRLPRYKLTIEYDGGAYEGWQAQPNGAGVQNALAKAIANFCGDISSVNGAGRTDAGVHASGQVAHIDLTKPWEPHRVREALNAHLREEQIVILRVDEVDESFDARFSATARSYAYRFLNRDAPPALLRGRVWHVIDKLDIDAMNEAAAFLIGNHDFTTFRHARCQAKSPVKTLDELRVTADGENVVIFAKSRSFLHNQVRSIAGSLKMVGTGDKPPLWIKQILEARDRTACGVVAPAQGLTLTRVDY